MKTNRTNSFRLHRISKTGSIQKTSQTFYDPDESFKLAALNSVTRGVKHADLSYLTGEGLHKLRVEPLQPNEGQYNSAHFNLAQIRKKYDEIKQERVGLEERIEKHKEEKGKLNIFRTEYEDRIGEAKTKAANLAVELDNKKILLDATATERKVLRYMEGRHKTDKVFYDQRKFDLEKELKYLRTQLSIFRKEGFGLGEEEDRTVKVYERLSKELEQEREEREAHIVSLETMIEEKLQLLNTNHEREADLYEIAERAIQDKDNNEKNWRKIFNTHIFVNKLLRNKIEKEMEKFKVVEFAFKEIKTSTGVSDAKSLVLKYLNKEAVYGELLGKIADNEKTIEHLKNETEELIQEGKTQEMELEVLLSIKIKSQDLHDNLKELEQFDGKAALAEAYFNKLAQWTLRQLKKIGAIDKRYEELEFPKSSQKLTETFAKYINALKLQSDKCGQIAIEEEPKGQSLGSKQNEKNTRIIPRRARLNSSGEEVFDVDEEEAHPSSQIEQAELINAQREELLRLNEKFMREAKRKYDEERRLLLDKTESKKDKSPSKAPQSKKDE